MQLTATLFRAELRGMSSEAELAGGAVKTEMLLVVAKLAMALGRRRLATYGSVRSRHDFTQPQLMACLILRAYLKTTYRGARVRRR